MKQKSNVLTAGLAMFSMFFGAGNVVFPLVLGQLAQDTTHYALLGMLITAVGVPFLGLIAMTLFNGNYHIFFERIGKKPGFLVSLIIMGLIGPFGAIPRCIALSFSTIKTFIPEVSLPLFSLFACFLIWLFTFRKNTIIDTLGYFLTPVLLLSLGVIILKGLAFTPPDFIEKNSQESLTMFIKGFKDGYQTMDLLGAFFFSSIVLACLKSEHQGEDHSRSLIFVTLKASLIGAFLLSIVYIGFSYVAAFHYQAIEGISPDQLISHIAIEILGSNGALIAIIAVALACLTTAIALTSVFAEFAHRDMSQKKLGYQASLLMTLGVTFFISTWDFTGIAAFLAPVLYVCYPALIALTIFNMLHKLYHVHTVKTPVFLTFLISLGSYFLF